MNAPTKLDTSYLMVYELSPRQWFKIQRQLKLQLPQALVELVMSSSAQAKKTITNVRKLSRNERLGGRNTKT